jgi:transposase
VEWTEWTHDLSSVDFAQDPPKRWRFALSRSMSMSLCFVSLILCLVVPVAAPGDADKPLGSGHFAEAAFQVAVAIVYFTLPKVLKTKRLIQEGTHWKLDGKGNPLREITAQLFRIDTTTVRNHAAKYKNVVGPGAGVSGVQGHLPQPQPHGPKPKTKEQYRTDPDHQELFEIIRDKIHHAMAHGYTLTIDKLALHVRDVTASDGDGVVEFTYSGLRYIMLRMGFKFGKISKCIKAGRTKDYVLTWLIEYARYRVQYADHPDISSVHAYVDETFLHRDATGNYSWYLDDNHWTTGAIPHTRWGIVQVLFTWWERIPGVGGRGRGRGRGGPYGGPAGAPQYVRRFLHVTATLRTWKCDTEGNMNSDKFLAWLRIVCVFVMGRWPGRTCVFHMDNASYHKKKDPTYLDIARARQADIVLYLMQHAPPELELDDIDIYLRPNGRYIAVTQLRQFARAVLPPAPRLVQQLLAEYGFSVKFTPPYWPESQPVELWNGNLKVDYYTWDSDQRGPNVGAAVQTFAAAVTDTDAEGWIKKTDAFCRAVLARDPVVLGPMVVNALPPL